MSAAQIQIILSSPESFAGLIGQTLAQDNATRRSAEDLYGQLKQQRPDACASNLLQLLRTSNDARVRATCAVFLRKFFKPGRKEAGWEQLNRNTRTTVKRELLAGLAAELDRTAAKQTADAVVALGLVLLEGSKGSWPELLGSLQGWLGAHAGVTAVTREAALQMVAGLALHMSQWSGELAPVVVGCLAPQHEADVQLAALKAVVEFLQVLRKPRELHPYQSALPAALAALQGALSGGKMAVAEQMLTELIRTAESEPGLWQSHVKTALPGMLALAGPGPSGGAPLPDELRRAAAEFVMTLVDLKPTMLQSELGSGPLAAQLVACVAAFLTSGVEDDPSWGENPMASPDLDEDDTLSEMHRYGLECAIRAAESLDRGAVLRAVVEMTSAWARDGSDWRRRHAVLMCLSQVVGSCKEVVGAGELASLAGLLAEGLRDPHPRVRWAACHTAGVLGDDLGPELQLQAAGGGAALLLALTELLAEPEGPACPQRVKAQACRGVVGFLEGLEEDSEAEGAEGQPDAAAARQQRVQQLLVPLLEPLSVPLLAQVERCAAGEGGAVPGGRALIPTPLQEYSLDVLTHLAVCLRNAFTPAFTVAMPRVLAVLARAAPFHGPSAVASGAVSEEEAAAIVRVQVGALECAAFMCRAAGPAAAAEHVPGLVAMLGLLARPDLESSSPLLVPLLNALEPLASCLGAESRHLLGPGLPLLTLWAGKDVGLRTFDGDSSADDASDDDDEQKSDGDSDGNSEQDDSDVTYVSYNDVEYRCMSSVLAAKAAAVSALEELVDKMGPALAPQVNVVADALLGCMLEYYLDEVAVMARRALPKLLRHYLTALTHGLLPPADPAANPAAAQALLHRIWVAVTTVIHPESAPAEAAAKLMRLPGGLQRPAPGVGTRADMVEVLTQVVDSVEGSMLQQSWVAGAFGALRAALAASQSDVPQQSDEEGDDAAEDKSMEGDGSVDLESEASDDDEEEDDDGEETEDESEAPEAARERLRVQVESCVAAFTRKYGDAVAALAQQVLASQRPEHRREAVLAVRNGLVA